ncbi:MAG: thioredoxin [Rickettsiales bacterium]|nr:thioredoxin [Rickettsiales bacterium]
MVTASNDNDFQKDVLDSEIPVVVDFWAEWCGPCKIFLPVFEELSAKYKDKIKFVKINIDESPEVPTKYGVRGIPNLILFKDGKNVDSLVGAVPKNSLEDWLNSHI